MRKDTTKVYAVPPRARKPKVARPRHSSESKFGNAERADDNSSRNGAGATEQSRDRSKRSPRNSLSAEIGAYGWLEALPVAAYRTDVDGWIRFYNRAASKLWGCAPAIGSTRWCGSWRLYSPDGQLISPEECPTALSLREGKATHATQAVIERQDGTRVSVLCYPTLLRDATGCIVGVISLLVNSASDETQRLMDIVEASNDAIICETLDGVVASWNTGATQIFGYTTSEMIGQPAGRIIPFDLQEKEREILARLALGERVDHFDTIRLARDGRRIPVSVTLSPLRDAAGSIVGTSMVARDMSERRQAEEALRRANREAQQARVDAEGANRAKTEFMAVMSHEIRTPLNSITGFVDLLTNSTELTPQQRRYAGLVKTASAALLTIVNDILHFSKVEIGKLDLERRPFSPSALIQDVIAILAPSATEKNLALTCSIECGVPQWITGDLPRLRQVLLNLLNNAVKFTNQGSITVNVRPQLMTDGRESIRFSIVDTGIGIPIRQQPRLFKLFSQADSSVSRQYGGTGLGLAICKQLVGLMGGEIGVISDVGQGSNVWFTICLPEAPGPAPEPELDATPGHDITNKPRILVVDDIDTNLEIVEAYLQDHGYQVDCVGSGLDAIQLLANTQYDLILMDVQMPIMDGVTATKRIRALATPICDIPIIAMTGNVMPQQVRAFLEAGMNDHVGKPIERTKLYSNVRRWLPRIEKAKKQAGSNSPVFDGEKLNEFILAVGSEKAARIADMFLVRLNGAFKSTLANAVQEAHDLINVASILGLVGFAEVCLRVGEIAQSHGPKRGRVGMEELQIAQSAARQAFMTELQPKLRGEPLRSTG